MPDHKQSFRLMKMAEKDFRALEGMLREVEMFSDEIFGFHAQQAVEKTLKSLLCFQGIAYPRIHDLEELFALVRETGLDIPAQYHQLIDLVDFAVQYRYEAFDEDLKIERFEIFQTVSNFMALINEILNKKR